MRTLLHPSALSCLAAVTALCAAAPAQTAEPSQASAAQPPRPAAAKTVPDTSAWPAKPWPPGMVWVPAGEYSMGTDDPNSLQNERPAHRVKLDGFWMDEHDVTNAEFARFVDATQYITIAERRVDWEELKKQVPPGTPKPPDEMLAPGSLAYTPPDAPVDVRDMQNCGPGPPARAGATPRAPNPGSPTGGSTPWCT